MEARRMESIAILGTTLGLSFVAGLRLYATVLAIGVGLRTGLISSDSLPSALSILANPLVIGMAGMLFLVELLAEKIPWLDSAWHSVHTLIAPVAAALIGSAAFGDLHPVAQTSAILLSGGVGLTAAAGKTTMRLAAPEPLSKLGLSLGEDTLAIFVFWFALHHPVLSIVLVAALLCVLVWLIRKLLRLLNRAGRSLKSLLWRPRAAAIQQSQN